MRNQSIRCPQCKSDELTFERAGGIAGYRCGACGKWSYSSELRNKGNTEAKNPSRST